MPLIGVIIPVYNVEKYLNQCVDSVLSQSFKDIEVILVNDGSTDKSGEICEIYKEKDLRVKVIHKENGGLSDARNAGIKASTAQYLLFLDSDDYWVEDSLEKIVECTTEDVDVVFLTVAKFFEKRNIVEKTFESLNRNEIKNKSQKEVFEHLARADKFPVAAWDKLIKREIIINNNMYFKKGLLSEDIDWTTNLLLTARKFDVCDVDFYIYRKQRTGSITGSIKLKNVTDLIYILKKWVHKCENGEVKKDLVKPLLALFAYEYTILMGHIFSVNKEERKIIINDVITLKTILQFSNNNKTKFVRQLTKIIGFYNTSFLLNQYIRRKS
ncbi:MAG TPA: glycosyltransferase [Niallia sp.]|nr:glycosyltransferase [Niallia sp.]